MVLSTMAYAPGLLPTVDGPSTRGCSRRPGRAAHRRWRRRGRRAQVAAVATILGLLLVVTFIANYLSTTLPQQMSVNDLDHELQVENQLGRLQALLKQVSSVGTVGAQVAQPVTLGSAGSPPFADADRGAIGPLDGANYSLSYSLSGPLGYYPPTGGTPNSGNQGTCTLTPPTGPPYNGITCAGSSDITYNFSATSTSEAYAITSTHTASYSFNITDNGTSAVPAIVTVTNSGTGSTFSLLILGSNVTVELTDTAANTNFFEFAGSNDTLQVVKSTNTATINVYSVGYADHVTVGVGAGSVSAAVTSAATFFGADDTYSITAGAQSHSGSRFFVYFNGLPTGSTVLNCPVANIAAQTDTVSGGVAADGTYSVTYNDTAASPAPPTPPSPWTGTDLRPSINCPFYTHVIVAPTTLQSAGIDVHLFNTYAPTADVAMDAGAVVYAQSGGVPIVVDPPELSVVSQSATVVTSVSLWLPFFIGTGAAESGIGTTELSARQIALTDILLTPSSSYTVENNTNIVFAVTTPFAAGWWAYYNATYPSSWISCVGQGCNGLYSGPADFGTVTLTIPTGTQLNYFDLELATFSFQTI
jgi:hypothetical protein